LFLSPGWSRLVARLAARPVALARLVAQQPQALSQIPRVRLQVMPHVGKHPLQATESM
jgi:hypothetical protein